MAEFATAPGGAPKKGGKKGEPAAPAIRFGRVKSNLKMGILGLPNVGKSSLFNLLTEQSVASENYPCELLDVILSNSLTYSAS